MAFDIDQNLLEKNIGRHISMDIGMELKRNQPFK